MGCGMGGNEDILRRIAGMTGVSTWAGIGDVNPRGTAIGWRKRRVGLLRCPESEQKHTGSRPPGFFPCHRLGLPLRSHRSAARHRMPPSLGRDLSAKDRPAARETERLRNIVPNLAWAELNMVNGQLDWTNRQRRWRADWLALQNESRQIQKDRRTNLKINAGHHASGSSKGVNKTTK
jgi:hypothetical protein